MREGSLQLNAVLISTYDLGRQPFGLASPAAWLRKAGARVTCVDLSRRKFEPESIADADLVAFYLPMHTATRLALGLIPNVRRYNHSAHLCAYGLYAPVNAKYLAELGVTTILGGEFEEGLCDLARQLSGASGPLVPGGRPAISLEKQKFLVPDRSDLPVLQDYAQLRLPDGGHRIVGYTEASRGCKHLCRHCPVVPVYNGKFRIVQRDVVLEDIRNQVETGAQHLTFGDPDFFNGIGHAMALVQAVHRAHPQLTYDVTIKVEHLLKYSKHLPALRDTGCVLVTSAVESVDNRVLEILDKGHTREDFIRVVKLCESVRLNLAPTFVAFHPWLTLEGYAELLSLIEDLQLVENIAPVQLAIRLLIPFGSRLLDWPEIQAVLGPFDAAALSYSWTHSDPRVDDLQCDVQKLVNHMQKTRTGRTEVFCEIRRLVRPGVGSSKELRIAPRPDRCTIPYLTEPWFC